MLLYAMSFLLNGEAVAFILIVAQDETHRSPAQEAISIEMYGSLASHQPMLTPTNFPIPKVIAAAARPKITCRIPEYQMLFPVNNVMAPPMRNNPTALIPALASIASVPVMNMKGMTGSMAPMANNTKE